MWPMVLLEVTKLALSSAEIVHSSAIATGNRATLCVWTTKHYNSQPADPRIQSTTPITHINHMKVPLN